MAKFIELSAEETIRTAELIGKALGFPLMRDSKQPAEAKRQNTADNMEEAKNGSR